MASGLRGAIAVTRLGMGAKPGEIETAARDPEGWLERQIGSDAALIPGEGLQSAAEGARAMVAYEENAVKIRNGEATEEDLKAIRRSIGRQRRDFLLREIVARNTHAITTGDGFAERWARFWANHFTVAARQPQMLPLAGAFEREAIRPNVFGRFRDLLLASSFHQGMLVYLDNYQSIGPSTLPARRRGAGLNENLAREILELHTLGVDGGYTQDDVLGLAKALTGWTVGRPRLQRFGETGEVVFIGFIHEPGSKTVLGKTYREDGEGQAGHILDDLARHPATAGHIARKLARHFIADTPPPEAVETLAQTFRDTSGDLSALARTLIGLEAAWSREPQKFKMPEELLISTARLLGGNAVYGGAVREVYQSFGQVPFLAPSPAGWPDTADDWAGPDAVMKRMEWANRTARRAGDRASSDRFLDAALGALASADTHAAAARAESRVQALTLAIMSPEFQRR